MSTTTNAATRDLHAIEFAQSKTKLLGIITAAFPTFYGAITILRDGPEKVDRLFKGASFILIPIAVLAMVFFGVVLWYAYQRLRDNQPGLIVSDEGITDHSSAVGAGFIPWSDVLEINEQKMFGANFMRIKVKSPDYYIDRQSSSLKRFMMRRNQQTFKAGLAISASSIRCSFEELKDLLNRRFRAYQESGKSNY